MSVFNAFVSKDVTDHAMQMAACQVMLAALVSIHECKIACQNLFKSVNFWD